MHFCAVSYKISFSIVLKFIVLNDLYFTDTGVRVSNLEEEVQRHDTDITNLEETMTTLQSSMSDLEDTVDLVEDGLTVLEVENTEIQQRITVLEETIMGMTP